MKTLVIYGSTYGFTKNCTEELVKKLEGEVFVVNILSETVPNLSAFDKVILGGSIYMGQIQKKLKEFCVKNLEELKIKNIGLFICCGLPENFEAHLKNVFPKELYEKAITKECFGGELNTKKMKFFHKILAEMMSKAANKEGKKPVEAKPENIAKLAMLMNSL